MIRKTVSFFVALCSIVVFSSEASASPNIEIKSYISVGDTPKYTEKFTHLEYVNPNAPKKGRITLPAY